MSPLPPSLLPSQVGRSVDETLRLVQAFQYTDKKGEGEWEDSGCNGRPMLSTLLCLSLSFAVCPAGWQPGEKTVSTEIT